MPTSEEIKAARNERRKSMEATKAAKRTNNPRKKKKTYIQTDELVIVMRGSIGSGWDGVVR